MKEKPIENYTNEEIQEVFFTIFFWVFDNRLEWLQEAIARKKRMLGKKEDAKT